ncbi:fatty acid desaturase [Cochlodiniinecator piscidefendens]|uniref:fatty acid desaturase n=1 Tax=Cochlodiniinecator piscidefendens TaxID=2715756 RepID=UPI00140B0190|nr:fatty acid desaturase [Cochlodiniinecator piscidefendens]
MTTFKATNAASSGIKIDKKLMKSLARRSDRHGLIYLLQWVGFLIGTGTLISLSLGSIWMWPAMFLYGIFLTVPAYSLSHETAHGTAFKTRWLNETVLWVTSLLYGEEPLHRRYTHTNHHTYTWHVGIDSQMPFDTPMTLRGWLFEITGLSLARFNLTVMFELAFKRYSDMMRTVIPQSEFPILTRNARIFIAIYATIPVLAAFGIYWPIWFFVLPRLLGAPVMLLFTLIQHVELQENSPSIVESTRSFRTNWLGRFLYMDMNNHVEHHLYPQIPFYALRGLKSAVEDQVPEPDPGFWKTNLEVLSVVTRRSLGKNTKAKTIRQAPHHVTDGTYTPIAKATM